MTSLSTYFPAFLVPTSPTQSKHLLIGEFLHSELPFFVSNQLLLLLLLFTILVYDISYKIMHNTVFNIVAITY